MSSKIKSVSLYEFVLAASARIRELKKGHAPKVVSKQGSTLTAIQEIEEGHINPKEYLSKLK